MIGRRFVLGAGAASLVWPGAAFSQSPGARIGLVIGNADYGGALDQLENPINDARAMAKALTACGFEMMNPVENGDRQTMLTALGAFSKKLAAAPADAVGFLYYSGHGAANSKGRNYLIGSGRYAEMDESVWTRSVSVDDMLAQLAASGDDRPQIISIDACRTPLQSVLSATPSATPAPSPASPRLRSFSGVRGIDVATALPVNQFISFSAWEGQFARDIGKSKVLGPYAEALTRRLVEGGRRVRDMFDEVRLDVLESTVQEQEPMGLVRLQKPSRDLIVAPPGKTALIERQRRSLRQALVVSCSYGDRLPKTHEDGDLVAGALRSSGFEVVCERNLQRNDLYKAIAQLQLSLLEAGEAAVGVVYFAGYGASNAKAAASPRETKNYLIPEGGLTSPDKLEKEALSIEKIVSGLLPAQAAAVVLLIDCGRLLFPDLAKSLEGRFFDQYSDEKVLVAFATEANQTRPTAFDLAISPYAAALADEIRKPERRGLEDMLQAVAERVKLATARRMTPRLMSTLKEQSNPSGLPVQASPIYFRDQEGLDPEAER